MTSAPYVDLLFDPNDITGQARREVQAAAKLDSVDKALSRALMAAHVTVTHEAKKLIAKEKEITTGTIMRVLDYSWQLFTPRFVKISAPQIVEVYRRAFKRAKAGNVDEKYIYALAEQHARRIGLYFHETSRDALIQGFNTYVNRKVPERAALDRALSSYGLTARQVTGVTRNVAVESKVNSPMITRTKKKVGDYIGTSLRRRIRTFATQEEHNLSLQGEQVAWMWKVEHGKASKRTEKIWNTAKDEKVCKQCGPMHGRVVPVLDKFELPNGAKLWVPGAHPNCRCWVRFRVPRHLEVVKNWDPKEHPRAKDGRFGTKRKSLKPKTHTITEEDRELYTSDKCDDLAQALHEKTGYPIWVVADEENGKPGWIHAGVMTPDGQWLDVNGKQDPADVDNQWADFWGEFSDIWLEPLPDEYELKSTPRANKVADALLKGEVSKADRPYHGDDPDERDKLGRFTAKDRTAPGSLPFKDPMEEEEKREAAREFLERPAPIQMDLDDEEERPIRMNLRPISMKPISMTEKKPMSMAEEKSKPISMAPSSAPISMESAAKTIKLEQDTEKVFMEFAEQVKRKPTQAKVLYRNTIDLSHAGIGPVYRIISPSAEIDVNGRLTFSHEQTWSTDPVRASKEAVAWRRDQIRDAVSIMSSEDDFTYDETRGSGDPLMGLKVGYHLDEEEIAGVVEWVADQNIPEMRAQYGGEHTPTLNVEWLDTETGEWVETQQLSYHAISRQLGLHPRDFVMSVAVMIEGHDSELGRTDLRQAPTKAGEGIVTTSGDYVIGSTHDGATIVGRENAPGITFYHLDPADVETQAIFGEQDGD